MSGGGEVGRGVEGSLPAVATTRLYSYLVTRHTGRAVRLGIERRLAEVDGRVLAVLDFREVPVIDFSCADEVVVKLVRESGKEDGGTRRTLRFFLFRGLREHHLDPIESALRRQSVAVAAEDGDGRPLLLGSLERVSLETWHEVERAGRTRARAVASRLGVEPDAARRALEELALRRLLLRDGEAYLSLRHALSRGDGG